MAVITLDLSGLTLIEVSLTSCRKFLVLGIQLAGNEGNPAVKSPSALWAARAPLMWSRNTIMSLEHEPYGAKG